MTHNSSNDVDEDEKGDSFPETARSLFDPLVKTMNRHAMESMARVLNSLIQERERQYTKKIPRIHDL